MDFTELFGQSERLTHARTDSEISQICREIAQKLGFDHFLFGLCNPTFSLSDPNIHLITDYPDELLKLVGRLKSK